MKKILTASALAACLAMGFLSFLVGRIERAGGLAATGRAGARQSGYRRVVASIASACRARISRRRWTASS